MLSWNYALKQNYILISPLNTRFAGPDKYILPKEIFVLIPSYGLKQTLRFPPFVSTFTLEANPGNLTNEAIDEAITPVPQDKVSSSTPLS